jgi:hypothetical protein
MKHEFFTDYARSCYHIAGQAAVAVVLRADIRRVWVDDDGGGVSIALSGRPGRDYWHQAQIATGGAAACCLYRSDKSDARECMRAVFRVIPGEKGSVYAVHRTSIESVRRRLKGRAKWLTFVALSELAIERSLMAIEAHWSGVQALAQHLSDWPQGTNGTAIRSIFQRAMESR